MKLTTPDVWHTHGSMELYTHNAFLISVSAYIAHIRKYNITPQSQAGMRHI